MVIRESFLRLNLVNHEIRIFNILRILHFNAVKIKKFQITWISSTAKFEVFFFRK